MGIVETMREARTGGATPLQARTPLPTGAATGYSEAAEGVGAERGPVPALPAASDESASSSAATTSSLLHGQRGRRVLGSSRRAGSEEAGDGAGTARWRRRRQQGEAGRDDSGGDDLVREQARRAGLDLPSATSSVRPTRPAGGCRVHSYVPQRERREQEWLQRLMPHAVGPTRK